MFSRIAAIAVFALATFALLRYHNPVRADSPDLPNTGMGDPQTLSLLYSRYKMRQPAASTTLTIPLISIGGISRDAGAGNGTVKISPAERKVSAMVTGLEGTGWNLWLVDNRMAQGSTLPESGDRMMNLGGFTMTPDGLVLNVTLPANMPADFEFDRAVVTAAGANPADGFALIGGANLYERLARGYVRVAMSDGMKVVESEADFWPLVARGRELFLRERFQGNSRTCATCHVESNNFTIDPAFIAKLQPSDPLFVHERNPELGVNLENKDLLRKLGVFIANADGYEDLNRKFVLRSAVNLQSIGTQNTAPEPVYGSDFTAIGNAPNLPERMGWGNDALPLRDFAIGAIMQHMTKTLARKSGTDFRVPSDEELDAMAAFQLSIGRAEDFDLSKLKLTSAQAIQGMKLYLDTGEIGAPGHKNCNACHFNAGGTGAFVFNPDAPGFSPVMDRTPLGFNLSAGTNVNGLPIAFQLGLPRDGGYGSIPLVTTGFGNVGFLPPFGEIPFEEFNSGSLVESADTAPYFHNHTVATLEEAVAFYGTDAYSDPTSIGSPENGPLPVKISKDPNDPEVQAISSFLRVLNMLENIRSAVAASSRARQQRELEDAKEMASLAREEVIDAMEVSTSGSLARVADYPVLVARTRLLAGRAALDAAMAAKDRQSLEGALQQAMTALRGARDVLADVNTLPASFRN